MVGGSGYAVMSKVMVERWWPTKEVVVGPDNEYVMEVVDDGVLVK